MVRPEQSQALGPAAAKTYGSPICARAKPSTRATTEPLTGMFAPEPDDEPLEDGATTRGWRAASWARRARTCARWFRTTAADDAASRFAWVKAALAVFDAACAVAATSDASADRTVALCWSFLASEKIWDDWTDSWDIRLAR